MVSFFISVVVILLLWVIDLHVRKALRPNESSFAVLDLAMFAVLHCLFTSVTLWQAGNETDHHANLKALAVLILYVVLFTQYVDVSNAHRRAADTHFEEAEDSLSGAARDTAPLKKLLRFIRDAAKQGDVVTVIRRVPNRDKAERLRQISDAANIAIEIASSTLQRTPSGQQPAAAVSKGPVDPTQLTPNVSAAKRGGLWFITAAIVAISALPVGTVRAVLDSSSGQAFEETTDMNDDEREHIEEGHREEERRDPDSSAAPE